MLASPLPQPPDSPPFMISYCPFSQFNATSTSLCKTLALSISKILYYFYASYFLTVIVCPTAAASSTLHLTYSIPDTLSCIYLSSSLPLPHPHSQTLLHTSQLLLISLIFPKHLIFSIKKTHGTCQLFF